MLNKIKKKLNKKIKRQHGKDTAVSIGVGLNSMADTHLLWEIQFPHTGLELTQSMLQTEARTPDSVFQKKEYRALSLL